MKLQRRRSDTRKAAAIVRHPRPTRRGRAISSLAARGAEIARDTVIAHGQRHPITVADMSHAADLTWDRINGRPVRKHNRAWRDTTRTARTCFRLWRA